MVVSKGSALALRAVTRVAEPQCWRWFAVGLGRDSELGGGCAVSALRTHRTESTGDGPQTEWITFRGASTPQGIETSARGSLGCTWVGALFSWPTLCPSQAEAGSRRA